MSIVNMVELELNIEVNEDMSAAIITASMIPFNPAEVHLLVLQDLEITTISMWEIKHNKSMYLYNVYAFTCGHQLEHKHGISDIGTSAFYITHFLAFCRISTTHRICKRRVYF